MIDIPGLERITEWAESQQVAFVQALDFRECPGCGDQISSALAACTDCFDGIPDEQRANIARTAMTNRAEGFRQVEAWFQKTKK